MSKKEKSSRRVAITGLSGVVGGILSKKLHKKNKIIDIYRSRKSLNRNVSENYFIDFLNKESIEKGLYETKPDVIVHLAAVTHIDICEKDKKFGKSGNVWKTNVVATREIAKFCKENKIPLVFLSTECVFDGKKDYFEESDKKNPINWYGKTKSEAEEEIINSGAKFSIIRSVVTYYKEKSEKTIYGKILNSLLKNNPFYAAFDQYFTPTYTYDIASAVEKVVDFNLRGILHVAPFKSITPYDFGRLIAEKKGYSEKLIVKTKINKIYGEERASLRLKNASLDSRKSVKLLSLKPKSPKKVII